MTDQAPTAPKRLLTEKEVESRYGIKVSVLRKWRNAKGKKSIFLPHVKLGRSVRYVPEQIEKLIREHLVGGE